jgi:hypothetical protein
MRFTTLQPAKQMMEKGFYFTNSKDVAAAE